MRRKSIQTRQQIIDAAYNVFYRHGFNHGCVDAIAELSGFTKRTLYQHFGSKDGLIEAVLENQHELALSRITAWVDSIEGDAETVVTTIFDKTLTWASQEGWCGSGFTRAAVEYSDLPGHPARKASTRHKEALEGQLRAKFSEASVLEGDELARSIMILIEGCLVLVLIHGDREYIRTAAQAALTLVRCHCR